MTHEPRRRTSSAFARLGLLVPMSVAACSLATSFDGLSKRGSDTVTEGGLAQDAADIADAAVPILVDASSETGGGTADADASTTTYTSAVRADGPLAYFRLDEPTGATAEDSVGMTNGSFQGTATRGVAGAVGDGNAATSFDGSGTRLNLNDVFPNGGTTAFSIELWAKPAVVNSSARWLVQRNSLTGISNGYDLYFSSNFLLFSRTSNGTEEGFVSTMAPAMGQWMHLVTTYDGAQTNLYVNGVSVGSHASSGPIGTGSVGALVFGDVAQSQFFKYQGALDEIAIYDKALPAARVIAHYKASGR